MGRARTNARSSSQTREKILDAGLKLFAQRGFTGTTTKDIARSAGVNEVTLFRTFGSKKALFTAVISERSPVAEISRRVSFDIDTRVDELLMGNAEMVLSTLKENRELFMVILGDAWRVPRLRNVISESGVEEGVRMVAAFMEALMDAGRIRRIEPQVAARALVGMIQSYFLTVYLLAGRTPSAEEERRTLKGFVSVFLDGMREEVGR